MIVSADDIWVFGYGSLIWKPDFPFLERRRARLHGFHRGLCAYSVAHRGTVARPGLIFALDRGGMCDGVVFRVAVRDAPAVIAALRLREQVTGVYRECWRPVTMQSETGAALAETQKAVCYVVDPHHRQYAGRLTYDVQAALINGAIGKAGPNVDYVRNTHAALATLGIRDRDLERLIGLIGGARRAQCTVLDGTLPHRIRQVAGHRGLRPAPGWSVRSNDELAVNHRKNLGY